MKIEKNIIHIAKNAIQNQSEAIKNLLAHVGHDFECTVRLIANTKGKVVLTGVGKSAIIAQKITATFNSTGTFAVFLHAADALHGDLGIVKPEDVVIFISKSGNTPEIKVLIPLIRRVGATIIALTGNTQSYLAVQADYVINCTIEREACPLNLAPTTSTTAALVMGDALAICLIEMRAFNKDDFGKLHPGGTLGKKLYLRVKDIYTVNQLPVVHTQATIKEVIIEISSKRLGATAVVNDAHELTGIITDGDLRRMLNKYENITALHAEEIMTRKPLTIDEDAYATEALKIMQQNNITQLIVMRENTLKGFIHIHDLLREGII
ncbi:MAG: KpsF/GutQ family sugar-phosphate isomerase [Cytophagaceae bacterium]|nr:KpsF/GutQ family sugar-phosphate isomerase [Cytophagaceae bacterium]MDW8457070.1 KpsF/GutQ family sugar-phosphate isomerase [Cytophagaceae bacterium]